MSSDAWDPKEIESWPRSGAWDHQSVEAWLDIHAPKARTASETHPLDRFRVASEGWWSQERFPEMGSRHTSFEPETWMGLSLFRKALEGGDPVRLANWEGNLVVPADRLFEVIKTVMACRMVRLSDGQNGNGQFLFTSEETMISITLYERGRQARLEIATTNMTTIRQALQIFDRCIIPDDPSKGVVFTLAQSMSGYQIRRLGLAGTSLERGNYTDEVLKDYDHVVGDLQTESPCGRLVIFAGPPGTGKTYLVRALLKEAPSAAFVIIPPHLVSELSGPEILPALTGAKNEINGPIVLVIEDADRVLVRRQDGEMNGISSMLNLGDGILGSVLDIRILATTNAEKLEMDPATRRPGRLCRYIEVNDLDPEKANDAFKRLTGKEGSYKEKTTIAQVYLDARNAGWQPPKAVPERNKVREEIL